MKFKEILERQSSPLYHLTDITSGFKILKSGVFNTKQAFGRDKLVDDREKVADRFVSLTRSVDSDFTNYAVLQDTKTVFVLIQLNPTMITNKNRGVSIVPVSYYGGRESGKDEMEERILTNNETVDIKDSVMNVIVYTGQRGYEDIADSIESLGYPVQRTDDYEELQKIVQTARKKPIY